VAGGKVYIGNPVEQDALIAGGEISLASTINRSARVAGGQVTLQPPARISGNATFGGGEIEIAGEVRGYVLAWRRTDLHQRSDRR
jgi:hypothetical protein